MEQLQRYEPKINRTSRFYYWLYKGSGDFDLEDLEQAGRIAVFNINQKRPEMLNNSAYVAAAIKYAIFGEMKKMKHKVKQIYLAKEYDEQIQIIDVLPTNERGDKLEELEELLYHIKHEFSQREAEGLMKLLDNCGNIYDLNLKQQPSTNTKDRIKVVTAMDLDDEDMQVYAEVLLGVREKFPNGYLIGQDARKKSKKYGLSLLNALGMSPKDLAEYKGRKNLFQKYRLNSFFSVTHQSRIPDFIRNLDSSINIENIFYVRKWKGAISLDRIQQMIRNFVKEKGKNPEDITKSDFFKKNFGSMLTRVFKTSPQLAIEFAFPGTYPLYREKAEKLEEEYGASVSTLNLRGGHLGFRGYESPLAYFHAHPEKYNGLGRREICRIDRFLYDKLRALDQIDHAIPKRKKRKGKFDNINSKEISQILKNVINELGKNPKEVIYEDLNKNGLDNLLRVIFLHRPRLAVEFAYPGTYPLYREKAEKLRRDYM